MSCSGGGGGGGGGNGAAVLQMSAMPALGSTGAGGTTQPAAFNVFTPSAATQVGPNDFAVAPAGDTNFIEIGFNGPLLASSILGTGVGDAGIVIQDDQGNPVEYVLDDTGAIHPGNAFPNATTAPALLRLYIQDPVRFPTTPGAFTAGQYTLSIVTSRLKGDDGRPFCILGNSAGSCANPVEVNYTFTVGGDSIAPAPSPNGATVPAVNAIVAVNEEYRIFFSEAIDFQSLVGINPLTATVNTTSLDPFMSIPFPVNNAGNGENIRVTFTPITNTVLPANYGFVLYMPDPFHNAREVRLRVVDMTSLVAQDAPGTPQNYGIPGDIWDAAGLVAPRNSANNELLLPPTLPLPGSDMSGPGGPATLNVTVMSASSGLGPTDSSNNGDGVLGVTDRARNPLTADIVAGFTVQDAPPALNFPSPPDLTLVTNANQVRALSGGTVTNNGTPVANGGVVTGQMSHPQNMVLDDIATLGDVLDVEFGAFVNFTSAGNFIHNPPRRSSFPNPPTNNGGDPAIPFPPGGQTETSLRQVLGLTTPSPSPALGTYLYIVDGQANEVRIFESNSMTPLGVLQGIPSPRGLGMSPTMQHLYISNFDQGTVTRVGANPLVTLNFHQTLNTIPVGFGPTSVSVQPENEDVFVINSQSNSISIIDTASQQQRVELTVGAGPRDIFVTARFICTNCTLAYMAFVTNFFDDSVSVYESDSPDVRVNNGPQGKIIDTLIGFSGPSGGVWNRHSSIGFFPFHMGAYIVNSTGTTVDQIGATNFGLSPTPGFMGPPGFRTFNTIGTYGSTFFQNAPTDATIENMSALSTTVGNQKSLARADIGGAGTPSVLLVAYPAAGQVAAYDVTTSALYGSVQVPGSALYTYYDQ